MNSRPLRYTLTSGKGVCFFFFCYIIIIYILLYLSILVLNRLFLLLYLFTVVAAPIIDGPNVGEAEAVATGKKKILLLKGKEQGTTVVSL